MEILTDLFITETSKFGHLVLYLLSTGNCCIDADGKMCSQVKPVFSLIGLYPQQTYFRSSYRRGGGETPHMKGVGMLVVSLRGINFGFLSHLGCSGQNAIIFSHEGLV